MVIVWFVLHQGIEQCRCVAQFLLEACGTGTAGMQLGASNMAIDLHIWKYIPVVQPNP